MDQAAWQQVLKNNIAERQRLERLTKTLTDDELRTPMEAGWTVSAVLAHLAFWDIRAHKLVALWSQSGVRPSAIDTDLINEVTRELALAIPPRAAAQLALDQALALDHLLEQLKPDLIDSIQTMGTTVHLERFNHRRTHLDEIEQRVIGARR